VKTKNRKKKKKKLFNRLSRRSVPSPSVSPPRVDRRLGFDTTVPSAATRGSAKKASSPSLPWVFSPEPQIGPPGGGGRGGAAGGALQLQPTDLDHFSRSQVYQRKLAQIQDRSRVELERLERLSGIGRGSEEFGSSSPAAARPSFSASPFTSQHLSPVRGTPGPLLPRPTPASSVHELQPLGAGSPSAAPGGRFVPVSEERVWGQLEKRFGPSAPVHCRFCSQLVEMKAVAEHELNCNYRPLECKHCHTVVPAHQVEDTACPHCGQKYKHDREAAHLAACPERPSECPFCFASVRQADAQAHAAGCALRRAPCPAACGEMLLAGEVALHQLEGCPRRLVLCPHRACTEESPAAEALDHAQRRCEHRPAECQHHPGLALTAKTLARHLAEECEYREVTCPHCRAPFRHAAIAAHEPACPWRLVRCPHPGCGREVELRGIRAHEEGCPHRPVACPHCQEPFPVVELGAHEPLCPKKFSDCPHCARNMLTAEVRAHIAACPERPAVCTFRGCGAAMRHRELPAHERKCAHRPHPCPHCRVPMPFSSLDAHVEVCDAAGKPCKHCGERVPKAALRDHLGSECKRVPVPCPNDGCDVKVPRNELEAHAKTRCLHREATCNACGLPFPHSELEEHQASCEFVQVECPVGCGAVMTRGEAAQHLCPSEEVPCPLAAAGCATTMKRRLVSRHLVECTYRIVPCPRGCPVDGIRAGMVDEHLKSDLCLQAPAACPDCDRKDLVRANAKPEEHDCKGRSTIANVTSQRVEFQKESEK
jgi:hypothetical protein